MIRIIALGFLLLLWTSTEVLAKELVSSETIKLQKDSTITFKLKNNTLVTYREIPHSEIAVVELAFTQGEASLARADRPGLGALAELMERGSVSYPKPKLSELLEKYSTGISCSFGIELGFCGMATLSGSLPELLPAFASVIRDPDLNSVEAELVLEQEKASEAAALQDPETYVNEVVNKVFYGDGHPYWTDQKNRLQDLDEIKLDNLKRLHARLLADVPKHIVVVGSLPLARLKELLEANFSFLPEISAKRLQVQAPVYDPKHAYEIAARAIPTSYIRAKFSAPGIQDADFIATQLMVHILSEELENEIRTKRSLSYSVYAQVLPYTTGIGVIHVSSSKPMETMEALRIIIDKLRKQKLSVGELNRYRTVFATSYFLKLEEHSSLSSSLRSSVHYFDSADRLYEMPRLLARITPEEVQKAAQTYLQKFRLGVVYRENGFKPEWAEDFLKAFH